MNISHTIIYYYQQTKFSENCFRAIIIFQVAEKNFYPISVTQRRKQSTKTEYFVTFQRLPDPRRSGFRILRSFICVTNKTSFNKARINGDH